MEHSGGDETIGFPTIGVGVGRCGAVRTRWESRRGSETIGCATMGGVGSKVEHSGRDETIRSGAMAIPVGGDETTADVT